MSGKNQGNRNQKPQQFQVQQQPQPRSLPKVTKANNTPIEIKRPQGNPQPPPPNQQHPNPPSHEPLSISQPSKKPVDVQISPEVRQQNQLRKQAHTYTIEQLKAKKHDREFTSPALFQFYAELQLFKRFMSNNHKSRGLKQSDMPVLQHKINSILLQFNLDTFQKVFNDIMGLGVDSDVFVLSYVNVVFKQAVLNPVLALLFSMLSVNISYVMKHTEYAKRMRELFLERCQESFVVPKDDTDRGTIDLLRGIVTFAGHLLRDNMLPPQLLNDWANLLMKSGNKNSLMMLIDLLAAGGQALIMANQGILDQLKQKMSSITDKELLEHYSNNDVIQSAVSPQEQTDLELQNPQMKHSPSMDKKLDEQYGTLFKRSSSIPLELCQLADNQNDQNDINSIVNDYLYNSDLSGAVSKLEELGYQKNDVKTAIDLLRAVVEQSSDKLLVISELVFELLYQEFYNNDMIKQAFNVVSKENPNDIEHGKKLVLVFAQLIWKEVVGFDDFQPLFESMKGIWQCIIPTFFQETDRLLGAYAIDEMMESDFWRQARFLDVDIGIGANANANENKPIDIGTRLKRMHDMEVADFYPQFEVAYQFREKALAGSNDKAASVILAHEVSNNDREDLLRLVFEVLLSFEEKQRIDLTGRLKNYFSHSKAVLPELAQKFGDNGKKLADLL